MPPILSIFDLIEPFVRDCLILCFACLVVECGIDGLVKVAADGFTDSLFSEALLAVTKKLEGRCRAGRRQSHTCSPAAPDLRALTVSAPEWDEA